MMTPSDYTSVIGTNIRGNTLGVEPHYSQISGSKPYEKKIKGNLIPAVINRQKLPMDRKQFTYESIVRFFATDTCQTVVVLTMFFMVVARIVFSSLTSTIEVTMSPQEAIIVAKPDFRNVADIYSTIQKSDVPLLWEIDSRINSVVGDVLVQCFNGTRTESSSQGLKVDFSVLNFAQPSNTGVHEGQIILSAQLNNLSQLFNPSVHGRLVSFFRHPVEIAIKRHQYLTDNSIIPKLSLKHFLSTPYHVDNIMVRSLTGLFDPNEKLTEDHLKEAQDFVRRKCLIGLYDQMEESLIRLEYLFLDTLTLVQKMDETFKGACVNNVVVNSRAADEDIFEHYPRRNMPGWNHMEKLNEFDVKLYWYAVEQFNNEQSNLKLKFNKVKKPWKG